MKENFYDIIQSPFIMKSNMNISDFDDWINSLRCDNERFVTVLRGWRMKNMKSFMQEIAAALQFPYYFGDNWNALDECIKDLNWISANRYVIGIASAEHVLSEADESDSLAFGNLLQEVSEIWSKPLDETKEWGRVGRPFHIIMQSQNESLLKKFGDIFK